MSTQKWWQDNDRYIPNPWDEIELLRKELDQMSITEAALRESLTALSRESVEYRLKIEAENAALKKDVYCCPPTTENDYEGFKWKDAYEELERENAALRADKARLDSIKHGWRFSCEEGSVGYPDNWFIWNEDWSQLLGSGPDLRAAIAAARKEEEIQQ